MRVSGRMLLVSALTAAIAGCGGSDEPASAPATAPDLGQPATSTPVAVASCLVGSWQSTETTAEIDAAGSRVSATGGDGVTLMIDSAGGTNLDLSGMSPVSFTGEVAGADLQGELTYAGTATTTIRTEDDQPTGTWQPTEDVNWDDVRITVDVSEPVQTQPFQDTPLPDVTTDQWTDWLEVRPVLGEGQYECRDDELVLSPSDDHGLTWTFRAS